MTICEKIERFRTHIYNRHLRIAEILCVHFRENLPKDELAESAFAILSLTFSYFETIEQFSIGQRTPDRQASLFFRRGFQKVFPQISENSVESVAIYKYLRCGIYHSSMPRERCELSRDLPTAIQVENLVIKINPIMFTGEVVKHFCGYCDLLNLHVAETIANFEVVFDSFEASFNARPTPNSTGTPNPADVYC